MPTLVLDPPPAELQQLLARRQRIGADRHDEMWDGVLHVTPAPHNRHGDVQQQLAELIGPLARRAGLRPLLSELNIGDPDDYRVPDGALLHARHDTAWNPTAALAVEIVSPGDETWQKLAFYAAHGVDELLIVDPERRSVDWLRLADEGRRYEAVQRSGLIELGAAELAALIDWP